MFDEIVGVVNFRVSVGMSVALTERSAIVAVVGEGDLSFIRFWGALVSQGSKPNRCTKWLAESLMLFKHLSHKTRVQTHGYSNYYHSSSSPSSRSPFSSMLRLNKAKVAVSRRDSDS